MITKIEVEEAHFIYNVKWQKLLILKRDFIKDYLSGGCKDKLFSENVKKIDLQMELLNIEFQIMQVSSVIDEYQIPSADKNVN
jgi:hypothetical protein